MTVPLWPLRVIAAGVLLAGCGAATAPRSAAPQLAGAGTLRGAFSSGAWTTFHASGSRTGAVPSAALPTGAVQGPISKTWSTNLGGAVYGQPLVSGASVFAATEKDRVVALNAATGAVRWSASLGTPLTDVDRNAGCGDIDPLGITSTPVLDPATNILYVVGEVVDRSGRVHHQLKGFNAGTGAVVESTDVDPPLPAGESAVHLLQRAGLALSHGRVYIAYGGNDGDCGDYHGWLVSIAAKGAPGLTAFEVARDGQGGAIWESGGAPAVAADGDVYVTTGNANPDPPQGGPDPKAYTESVVRLSPTLRPLASFKDRVAGGDEDLATGNPVLLTGGIVFAVGKTDIGYLLDATTLKQEAAISGICGSDPDGGPAYDAATKTVFVPCRGGGIQEVDVATHRAGPRLAGADGSPILIGGELWAAQYPTGTLSEYDAKTGARLGTLSAGGPIPFFVSPSTGGGLLLLGTRTGVAAWR